MRRSSSGFTLLEVLIVVALIAIVMGSVTVAMTSTNRDQAFRSYIETLVLKIELARDKATQSNREWGVYVREDGVSFALYDELNLEWVTHGQDPFLPEAYGEDLYHDVSVDPVPGLERLSPDARDNDRDDETDGLPDIVIFSSGETTPFELAIEPTLWEAEAWTIYSDGFSRVRSLAPGEERDPLYADELQWLQ